MGWIHQQSTHTCELPRLRFLTIKIFDEGAVPGDVWQCDTCEQMWIARRVPLGIDGTRWRHVGWLSKSWLKWKGVL